MQDGPITDLISIMYGNKMANGLEYQAPMFSRCFVCKAKNYRTYLKGHLLFGTISCLDCGWYADKCSIMADRMGISPSSKSCKHVNIKWNYEALYNVMKTVDPIYMSEFLRQYLKITFRMRKFKPWCEAYFLFQESMKSIQDNKDFCKQEIEKTRKLSDSSSSVPSKEDEEIRIDLLDSDISTCDDDLDNYLVNTQNFSSKENVFTLDTVNNCPVKPDNFTLNQNGVHMLHIDKNQEDSDQFQINATKRVLFAGSKPLKVGNCSKENDSNSTIPTGDNSNYIDLTNFESNVKEEPSTNYISPTRDNSNYIDLTNFESNVKEELNTENISPNGDQTNCIDLTNLESSVKEEQSADYVSPTEDNTNYIDLTNFESNVKEEPSTEYDDEVLSNSTKNMDVRREKISMLPSNVRSNCITIDILSDFCLLCGYSLSLERMVWNSKIGCIIFFCSNCKRNLIYFIDS